MAARRLIVEIVGDADKLERELRKSQRSVDRFGSKMSSQLKAGGIAAGLALGAGIAVGLKNSVDAATEAQAVLGQTQVALKNVGKSWDQYGARIQLTTTNLSRLAAVNDEDLLQSFQVLLRGTKDVTRALELNAVAADLARGRNMDQASAAQLLVKVNAGQLGSARRLGIQIGKNATSQSALAEITRRYAGAAEAYGRSAAGAQDRFKVAIGELQETIGTALLPTVTEYLGKATKWLENTENTEELTRRLEATVELTAKALDVMTTSAGAAAGVLETLGGAAQRANDRLGGIPGKLARIVAATANPAVALALGLSGRGGVRATTLDARSPDTREAAIPSGAFGPVGGGTAGQSAHQLSVLAEKAAKQANTWFDARIARMLGRAGDPVSLREQIGRLRTISGLISQRLAVTKDITRRRKLEDQVADIAVQVRDRQTQINETAAAEAADRKQEDLERRRAATRKKWADRKAAAARAQAALDRKFGWLEFGVERANASGVVSRIRRAYKAQEKALVEQIRAEGTTLDLTERLWRVREDIRNLNKSKAGTVPVTTTAPNLHALTAGLGLGGAQLQQLRFNLAGAHLMRMPGGGYGSRTVIDNHVRVDIDGRQVAAATRRHAVKAAQREPSQTRGRQTR